jgi:hypothetical protein
MLKISFLDFWDSFNPEQNFFLDAIKFVREGSRVTAPENADLIICSVFGNSHESYRERIPIIQFIGEPRVPQLAKGTCYLTFCYGSFGSKNYRLPLWLLQFDWFNKGKLYGNPNFLIPQHFLYRKRVFQRRDNLCVSIFNHDPVGNRVAFLRALSDHGVPVHAFGKPFFNWFVGESKKMEILSNFQFAQCFENSAMPGYHTEKLIHAYFSGCIPVYWGSDTLDLEFNEKAIVLFSPAMSPNQLVDEILNISGDKAKIRSIFEHDLFKVPPSLNDVITPVLKVLDNHCL